jgi:hypothetical protein
VSGLNALDLPPVEPGERRNAPEQRAAESTGADRACDNGEVFTEVSEIVHDFRVPPKGRFSFLGSMQEFYMQAA